MRLLKHAAGIELLDAAEVRRLDPLGTAINERAHRLGCGEMLKRRDHDRWKLQSEVAFEIRKALNEYPPQT